MERFKRSVQTVLLLLLSGLAPLCAQKTTHTHGGGDLSHQMHPGECITEAQRAAIQATLAQNQAELLQRGMLQAPNAADIAYLSWPLRQKAGVTDPSYYAIGNFVDEQPGTGILDYNCGQYTYDGHKGTDIGLWPFGWTKMANSDVEIIAAASGTIIGKDDGNFDQNCSWNGQSWNAVYIRHADGSIAWYGHMKKNSLTSKPVGATVTKGEYLGVVGSSGISTGPHLHFEVYAAEGNLIDPWGGPCNFMNGNSWWSPQHPYWDPKICKIMTHNAAPSMPQCPPETVNSANAFQPGQTLYAAGYFRDFTANSSATYRLYRPDGSIAQTWTPSYATNAKYFWWYYNYTLPSNAQTGTWTFRVTYFNQTVDHNFTVGAACNTPTGLSTTLITTTTARFNWAAVSGALNYSVQYRLANGTWTDLPGGPFTTNYVNVSGFTPGTTYEWRVRSNCNGGQFSAWSAGISFTTLSSCNTPTGLSTTLITTTTARFNWGAVSGALNYSVQWRLAGGTWNDLSGGPFTNTYVNVSGFTPGTTYEWRVRSNCSGSQFSAWSAGISFTTLSSCNTPTGLSTTLITTTTARFNWGAVSGALNYSVQWRLAGGTWNDLSGGPFTNTYVNVSGFTPGTTYEWRVRSNCSGGQYSAWSAGISFTTLSSCNTPTGLSTTLITTTTARFNWAAVSGALNYSVQYRLANGTWTDLPGGPFTTNYVNVSGFTPGTTYEWRVRSNCSGGQFSAWSAGISFTTLSACSTPTGLYTNNITTTTAQFNWAAVSGALNYSIQWRLLNGTWTDLSGGPFTNTYVNVSGFTPGTTYEWRVRSNCSGGQFSAWSAGVSFTTAGGCGTPAGLSTTSVTQVKATLNWGAVSGATSYIVQFYLNGTWTSLNPLTATSVQVYGLYANQTYQWRVIAVCASGQSLPSASVTFNTATAPDCTLGSQYPNFALNPSTNWQYQDQIWGGEYCLVNVQAGQVYTFSYCSSDGGVLSFDGELSIRTTNNVLIMYSNNACGTQPRLVWQAGFTGQVRVLLTRYNCLTQQTNSTMAYRIGGTPLKGDDSADQVAEPEVRYLGEHQTNERAPEDAILPVVAVENEQPAQPESRSEESDHPTPALALLIAPNPASDVATITAALPPGAEQVETAILTLLDMNGKVWLERSNVAVNGDGLREEVEVSGLPAGVYVVRVRIGDLVGQGQLVRMR